MEWVFDQSSAPSFILGSWILQGDGLLLHDGNGLHLPPKELHVLRLLLDSAGSLVSKDTLLDQVWPNCDVAEESLTRCIYALRKVFGRQNEHIKTVYGKGYRFVGEVVVRKVEPTQVSVPSLLVLPLIAHGDCCGMDLHCEVVRMLATTFGDTLRVMPFGLTVDPVQGHDRLALIERMAPDYYLSARCIAREGRWSLSIELVRGRDHALLHSQDLLAFNDRAEVWQQLATLVAQRVPGLRPGISSCGSYPLALAYLNGLLGLQGFTAESIAQALVEFLNCIQLNATYAPSWCGLADTYLAMAIREMKSQDKALALARAALSQALALEPGNVEAAVRLALITTLQGAPDAGELMFRTALLRGDRAQVRYYYAWHKWCCGQHELALKSLKTSLEEDPSSVCAWFLRARITLDLCPKRTLEVIDAATVSLGGGHEAIYALHALALDLTGDDKAALNVLRQAHLLDEQPADLGLAACYVLGATDVIAASQHYEAWCRAANHPPMSAAQLTVKRRLDGDRSAAVVWHELEYGADPWRRTQLGDPRLTGLVEAGREYLQA